MHACIRERKQKKVAGKYQTWKYNISHYIRERGHAISLCKEQLCDDDQKKTESVCVRKHMAAVIAVVVGRSKQAAMSSRHA